ncbi:tetratricopeptide repeat protein [Rhodobacteraceae bacterium B1Z28]|uniref:Tetratricopeptide repeat protein n=2 Tax=Ruegeria haliotis TaxID=2747601 RepID=A0ABX2PUE4_9RHOB|nr:tetratricopeptide repeat protein [Ruegeria haliotis]NVO57320.1 tetratricopeptide repeat protein [Ruegeria haliotis]
MVFAMVASCTEGDLSNSLDAPGIDPKGQAEDNITVGNRLMAVGEYELALETFTRAALDQGMTTQVLTSMGTANLGLRRLGQAEKLLRRAVEDEPDWPVAWNNLGVLLMETQQYAEAAQVFQRAYALDNGESDAIRDNLRLALANMENPVNNTTKEQEYTLEQLGDGQFSLRKLP